MRVEQSADGRTEQWQHHMLTEPASTALLTEMIAKAEPQPHERCVDLGAGIGTLSLVLAGKVGEVVAVEPAHSLRTALEARASRLHMSTIRTEAVEPTDLIMPMESCDLVVSGLVLHHCLNVDKRTLVPRARRWLRPGGRLVIGDMMPEGGATTGLRRLGRGGSAAVGRGRIDSSAGRIFPSLLHLLRETPASGEFWVQALTDAGFRDVGHQQVEPGLGVVWGRVERPHPVPPPRPSIEHQSEY